MPSSTHSSDFASFEMDRRNRNSIEQSMFNMGLLMVGTSVASGAVTDIGKKFFESNKLPIKATYVDWWPRLQQKVQDLGSKFWNRRAEAATVSGLVGAVLTAAWIYSGVHAQVKYVWDLVEQITTSCLKSLGFQDNFNFGNDLATLVMLPSFLGVGTSIGLGSYDLANEYFDRDLVLETEPIFGQDLQVQLDKIITTTQNNVEEQSFFQNILLYGRPGTGKTMISKWIAKNSHMNYMVLSGGNLLEPTESSSTSQNAGNASATFQKIINQAKHLTSPTLIFVDEVEAVFAKRGEKKSAELISFLNKFLSETGQPSSKIMYVFATNRPNDIDEAVLSRMDYKIYVGPPELKERNAIIHKVIEVLITSPEHQSIFTENLIDHIAIQTEGLTGRDIFKLINRLKAGSKKTLQLNTNIIDSTIKEYIIQEQNIQNQKKEDPLAANPFYIP